MSQWRWAVKNSVSIYWFARFRNWTPNFPFQGERSHRSTYQSRKLIFGWSCFSCWCWIILLFIKWLIKKQVLLRINLCKEKSYFNQKIVLITYSSMPLSHFGDFDCIPTANNSHAVSESLCRVFVEFPYCRKTLQILCEWRFHGDCSETVLRLRWDCTDTALRLHCELTRIAN